MNINACFTYEKVKHDQENEVHLVVGLKAPKTEWQDKRPPVCVIYVVDVSGSMQGEKIDYAKKSVIKSIDHFRPGDYCGLIAFTTDVTTIFKPVEVTQAKKEQLRAKVLDLNAQNSTNLSGGMLEGLEQANKLDLPDGCVVRVILLTDGVANCGVAVAPDAILKLLGKNLGKATVSAFGYGNDCNHELLSSIAKVGKGNYAFIKNPDDALTAFAKELGGLLSTYAQDIVIEVTPHNGHRILEVVSDVDVEQADKSVKIKLPEILAEEERNIVLSMKLSEQSQALPRAMNVADVSVSFDLLDDTGKRTRKTEETKAKIQFVKDGEQQEKPTPEVAAILGLALLVKAQAAAEVHAQRGNFTAAQAVLRDVDEDFFIPVGLTNHSAAAKGLSARMSNRSEFMGSAGYRNSMKNAGSRAYGTSGMDKDAEADMGAVYCSMGQDMQSNAQDAVVRSFTGDAHHASVQVDPKGNINVKAPGGSVHVSAPAVAKSSKKDEKKEKSLSKKRSSARW